MFPYSLTKHSLTVVTPDNKVLTCRSDNINWDAILEALKNFELDRLVDLMSVKKVVENFGADLAPGAITISNGQVFFRNEQLTGLDVDRILEFISKGLPVNGMVAFLEKKLANPSRRSIESLYWFLENGNMPITPKGTFLAYKGVSQEYNSINTGSEPLIGGIRNSNGSIVNTVGQTVHMERRYVTDDFNQGCGPGLHAGSINYAKGWGPRVVIVEIDPADVVSVPNSEHEKLRCNKYTVVGEYFTPLSDTYTEEFHPELAQPKKLSPEIQKLVDEAYEKGRQAEKEAKEEIDEWNYDEDQTEDAEEIEDVDGQAEYDDGYDEGQSDGRGHKRKQHNESERNMSSYIDGYLDGYKHGRNK